MFSEYIIYTLIFLWAIHSLQKIFYCIYFWQLKEYRLDRMTGDIKRFAKALFPNMAIIPVIVLLLAPLFYKYNAVLIWDNAVLVIFYLLGLYSIFLLIKKGWNTPKFTKKAIFLCGLSAIILGLCLLAFKNNLFLFITITELALPLATLLIVEIFQIPTLLIKKSIYKKAKEKITQSKNLTVIGITGSYGKSSTKEFLYTFLSKKYKVLKTSGNTNTEIGIAKTIITELKPEHEIFIVEMAAYKKGEIELLCDIAQPKIGVVTGVNEQHLALFGSMKNLLMAEGGGELSKSLPKDGTLYVNGDNKYCLYLYKNFAGQKKIYSLSNKMIDSDIWSDSITVHKDSISFLAINKLGDLAHFGVNVLGKQNVQNLLGAILIASELGVNFGDISDACKDISQKSAGATLKKGKHGINIIDSSYSANPDGVIADLEYLSIFPGKKVIVMPCLIELGTKSSEVHEKIGRKMGKVCDLAIITNKDKFKEIEKGFRKTQRYKGKCVLCDKPQDIYSMITLFCKEGDTVLLEGRIPAKLTKLLTE